VQDVDQGVLSSKSPAKLFASKYRPVMMRPMTTAVSKAQADFKPFVTDPADIDHNMYGKFLGILKGAIRILATPQGVGAHAVLAVDAYAR
jgi:hypothetical protein